MLSFAESKQLLCPVRPSADGARFITSDMRFMT
jgi:hypothetical protein